jgi:outer membrane immunogenic protein
VFGGQIGYNWQMTNWVFGIETDAQWTGQRGSASALCPATPAGGPCLPGLTFLPVGAFGTAALVDQKLEWFGTLRGRVGMLVAPSWLLYVTGGGAYGTVRTDLTLLSFTANGTPVSLAASNKSDRFGWTVGGGVEGKFASNWSAKIEYLYMDLGSVGATVTVPTAGALGIGASVNSRLTDNIIRGGINYHFSAGPAPLMARY